MTYRLRNIAIAIALAVLAAMLTSFYVRQEKQSLEAGQKLETVYVAKQDIEPGTPAAEASSMLTTQKVASGSVAPGAIVSTDQLSGKVVTQPIYAGEQVSALRLSTVQAQGIRAKLTGTLRAVQVAGDEHQLLAGTLKEGDQVDVVANLKYSYVNFGQRRLGTNENTATRVILRDILVLRGVQTAATDSVRDSGGAGSVILAVTDAQAQKLFFAMRNGDWTLQLRPPADAADSPESVETVGTLLGDGLKADQIQQLTGFRPREEQ
jgi:Flp pilus assembly protein CpaB